MAQLDKCADAVIAGKHFKGRLLCSGILPCVVRNNRHGQLVWLHLQGTPLFHLAIRPVDQSHWDQFSVGIDSNQFKKICAALNQ